MHEHWNAEVENAHKMGFWQGVQLVVSIELMLLSVIVLLLPLFH